MIGQGFQTGLSRQGRVEWRACSVSGGKALGEPLREAQVLLSPKPHRFTGCDVVPETSPGERGFAADMKPLDLAFEQLQAPLQSGRESRLEGKDRIIPPTGI
jgi:hypothetical protein